MAKKAKQWKTVGLPSEPEDEQSERFQEIIRLKDARAGLQLAELVEEFNDVQDERDIISKRDAQLSRLEEALERLILEHIDKQGAEQIKIGGRTFSERIDVLPNVTDKKALFEWVKETCPEFLKIGEGHLKTLVKEALDPEVAATMTPAQRAGLKAGEPGSNKLPPGVGAYTRRTLGSPRSKK
jgi:hypothetical protein